MQNTSSKFNLGETLRLDPPARLHRYLQLTEKHRDSESWRQIALHILSKQDHSNQYTILKQVLSRMKNSDRKVFMRVAPKIDRQFQKCHTMGGVLVLVKYILATENKDCEYFAEQGYKDGLRKFGLFEKEIQSMEGIAHIDHDNPIFAEIESAVEVIPRVYNKLKIPFDIRMLRPFILWLTLYRTKNYEYCVILDEFCKFVVIACANVNKLLSGYDIEGTATLISEVLNKCLLNYPNSNNMCLIFENMSELEVETAVVRCQKMFCHYSSADMIKFSNVLTKGSLGNKTIRLFLALSIVMKNLRMNDKLVEYFRGFIIPKILLWGKTSEPAEVEIKSLIDFYVNGLLERTPNKEQCISNILTDFNRLSDRNQEYWTKIMYKIAYNEANLIVKINRECKGIANPLRKEEFDKLELQSWRIIVNVNGNFSSSSNYLTSSIQQHLPPTNSEYKPQDTSHRPPTRPFYQQSPVSEKRNAQTAKNFYDNTPQPYVTKTSGADRTTNSGTIQNRQSQYTSTPQQSRYGYQTGNISGFDNRSPADKNKVSENQSKMYKTTSGLTANTVPLISTQPQQPPKRLADPKVTPTKTSLIPAKSMGYNTNYADMTIMILFALEKFPGLLNEIKDQIDQSETKFHLLKQLNLIFTKLANFQGKQITIRNVMSLGPQQFKDRDKQFQMTEYTTKLFGSIINDLERIPARFNSTQKFKQLFENVIKKEAICPQCNQPVTEFANTFFLTIPSHQPLRTEWESQQSITCEKCRATSQNVIFRNKVISSPTLTMIQLSNHNKRRLSLPRHWNNSTLVGLVIVNSASSVSIGEYRFYYRFPKSPLVWYQFTPSYPQSLSFTNQEEDDQFQAKFMTHIAIYLRDQ